MRRNCAHRALLDRRTNPDGHAGGFFGCGCFAWYSSDATRDVLISAKASIATVLPVPSAAAQSEASTQLTPRDVQLKDPTRLSGPANQTPGANPARAPQQVAMLPSREEISTAYQTALQNHAPAPAPAAAPARRACRSRNLAGGRPAARACLPQRPRSASGGWTRRKSPTLMQRAKGLLASGDIAVRAAAARTRRRSAGRRARLCCWRRPMIRPCSALRTSATSTPEPAKAARWYQKAAQLGSADAQRRLAQLQN